MAQCSTRRFHCSSIHCAQTAGERRKSRDDDQGFFSPGLFSDRYEHNHEVKGFLFLCQENDYEARARGGVKSARCDTYYIINELYYFVSHMNYHSLCL